MRSDIRSSHRPRPRGFPALSALMALTLAVLLLAAAWPGAARADDAKAREIMQKVNNRDDGDNETADVKMVLIDNRGHRRERDLKTFRKDKGEDTYTIMFFLAPADVKGTGFLTYDYAAPGKDDDQWLYLPALRKSKRIASSDKSGSFMGSDFNYSDMTKPDLDDFDFTLVKEEDVEGHKTWQIQAVPRTDKVKDDIGYEKSMLWVRQDNYVVIRGIRWVYQSSRVKFMKVNKLERIDGIWIPTEMQMVTQEGQATTHATVLQFNNVRFNQKLSPQLFTVRELEKGL
ncbi:MAG TPA: outer membrane lipoprotein-sorting protein [bacterium]|nr:outer membrane lipoprotein-sorting protein [bacterium]